MPMNNYYHNDDDKRFSGVINTLKSLPHISAPPDFEMNLRRALNSLPGNEPRKEKKSFFLYWRTLVPAAAMAFTIVLIFFLVSDFGTNIDNPFMADPQLKAEYSSTVNTKSVKNLLIDPINITSRDVVIKKRESTPQPPVESQRTVPRESNTALAGTEREPDIRDFLRSNEGSNVDRSLRAKPQMQGSGYSGTSQYVSFDGFNLVNEDDDRTLYELKARMDSLKRLMRQNR